MLTRLHRGLLAAFFDTCPTGVITQKTTQQVKLSCRKRRFVAHVEFLSCKHKLDLCHIMAHFRMSSVVYHAGSTQSK